MSSLHDRNREKIRIGGMDDGIPRYFDENFEVTVVKIFSGNCYISTHKHEMLVTILGSCVSACVRDTGLNIGGMNHFLLPGDEEGPSHANQSMRYGVFAMESLLNGLYKLGAKKERLEFKLIGGGNVTGKRMIGTENANFIREFVRKEGYHVVAEDLEGTQPRRVHYFPDTGKVMVRKLRRQQDMEIVKDEISYKEKIRRASHEGDVELFE